MSAWVAVGVAVVLAIITAYYAWEARLSRRIAAEQLDSLMRPIVTVSLLLRHNHMIYLRVANDGHSPASDVRLTVDQQIPTTVGIEPFTDAPLFVNGSVCIPPGAQYFFALGGASIILGGDSTFPATFGVMATYRWRGLSVSEHTVVDVGSYKGSQASPRTESEAIEDLTDHLKKRVPTQG
jgi:hypothetical protein